MKRHVRMPEKAGTGTGTVHKAPRFPWSMLWDIGVLAFWKECDGDPEVIAQRMTEIGLDPHPSKEQIRVRIRTHEFNTTRVNMGMNYCCCFCYCIVIVVIIIVGFIYLFLC